MPWMETPAGGKHSWPQVFPTMLHTLMLSSICQAPAESLCFLGAPAALSLDLAFQLYKLQ